MMMETGREGKEILFFDDGVMDHVCPPCILNLILFHSFPILLFLKLILGVTVFRMAQFRYLGGEFFCSMFLGGNPEYKVSWCQTQ